MSSKDPSQPVEQVGAGDALAGAPAEVVEAYKRLTSRQRAFALALPSSKSQQEAALQAGFAASTARKLAFQYAELPDVKVVTDYISGSAIKSAELSVERCLAELAKLVGADPRELFDEDGALLPPDQWPVTSSAAISEVQQVDLHDGDGAKIGRTNKVKFVDKTSVLALAFKLLDAFPEKKKQVNHTHRIGIVRVPAKGSVQGNEQAAIEGQARRVEQPAKKKGNAPAFMLRKARELAPE